MDSDGCHVILFDKSAFLKCIINNKSLQDEHPKILPKQKRV